MTPTGNPVFSGAARGRPRVLNHQASIPHVYRVGVAFPEGPELLPFYEKLSYKLKLKLAKRQL
jgi:hypothetical protein